MKYGLLLLMLTLLFSCYNNSGSSFASSDSLVIQFKSIQPGVITKTVSTTDSKAISKIADYTHGKEGGQFNCGYNGNLLFYAKGKLVNDVSFNNTDADCLHFIWKEGENVKSVKMSSEAASFLKSLSEGRSWY